MKRKGLFIIYTGSGKGKTTAALGLALRLLGHGKKVCMIQFIKSPRQLTGEQEAIKTFGDRFELYTMGEGFVFDNNRKERHKASALKAWMFAQEKIRSGLYDLVILDELSYLFSFEYLDASAFEKVVLERPPALHICLTGRDMPPRLIDKADLVTHMHEIKHPLINGERNILGIDY